MQIQLIDKTHISCKKVDVIVEHNIKIPKFWQKVNITFWNLVFSTGKVGKYNDFSKKSYNLI